MSLCTLTLCDVQAFGLLHTPLRTLTLVVQGLGLPYTPSCALLSTLTLCFVLGLKEVLEAHVVPASTTC
jgi:hypothetical protein